MFHLSDIYIYIYIYTYLYCLLIGHMRDGRISVSSYSVILETLVSKKILFMDNKKEILVLSFGLIIVINFGIFL
jgi:hypothetical protein